MDSSQLLMHRYLELVKGQIVDEFAADGERLLL
jgi:hypothetical protein